MDKSVRVRSLMWFACGAVAALVATLVVTEAWRVDAAPGDDDSTFVPIEPCRLADTRQAPHRVGTAATLGPAETEVLVAHGSNGECTISSEAVGLSLNVTAVGASQQTHLTIWGGGGRPLASSLNPTPGQPPTPNAVTTPLAGDGSFRVFNLQGSVDVVIDVVGFYTKSSLQELSDLLAQRVARSATAEETDFAPLTDQPTAQVEVTVTAPIAGHVTLNSTAAVGHATDSGDVRCQIVEQADAPIDSISIDAPSAQWHETGGLSDTSTLAGTRAFPIAAGETVTYQLVCEELTDGGFINARNLTAIFTPEL